MKNEIIVSKKFTITIISMVICKHRNKILKHSRKLHIYVFCLLKCVKLPIRWYNDNNSRLTFLLFCSKAAEQERIARVTRHLTKMGPTRFATSCISNFNKLCWACCKKLNLQNATFQNLNILYLYKVSILTDSLPLYYVFLCIFVIIFNAIMSKTMFK